MPDWEKCFNRRSLQASTFKFRLRRLEPLQQTTATALDLSLPDHTIFLSGFEVTTFAVVLAFAGLRGKLLQTRHGQE